MQCAMMWGSGRDAIRDVQFAMSGHDAMSVGAHVVQCASLSLFASSGAGAADVAGAADTPGGADSTESPPEDGGVSSAKVS